MCRMLPLVVYRLASGYSLEGRHKPFPFQIVFCRLFECIHVRGMQSVVDKDIGSECYDCYAESWRTDWPKNK